MRLFLLIIIISAVVFGIITFQNPNLVDVTFIKWTFSGHLTIALLVSYAAGLLGGIALVVPSVWKKARQARQLKKRVQELEQEMEEETPLPDEHDEQTALEDETEHGEKETAEEKESEEGRNP